ncbi:YdcF family protein [Shinella zoogloeoides]|uniref:YdcF family protein n=1 Tax=Shinella zoogloeoides TaxID=352475 RepID=UPI001F5A0467|nr:YdcF family protein [Shinella zoogloeoides]
MSALEREKPKLPEGARQEGIRRGRKGPVRILVRVVLALILLAGAAGTAGFLHFAETVAALETPRAPKADAIVVLTGGYQRIDRAIDLLKNGAGERLLISGANPATSGNLLRKLTQSSSALFECCVDMGYEAVDTIGNANEAARWISDHQYRRVLVVTNNYHMPRSLLELKVSDPQTEFIAYPVVNSDLKNGNWLREPGVMKAMLSEYLKYCLARLRAFAGARSWSGLRGDMTGS